MYTIEAKILADALAACTSAIAMGSKSETQSVIMQFDRGLTLVASNTVATYRTELPITCVKPVRTTVTVLPTVLAAYTKGVKQITLDPQEAHLLVKGDKRLQAEVYYVGAMDMPAFPEVTPDADLESMAAMATTMLQRAGSIRNRTDKQELAVSLVWSTTEAEMIIGDSHHVAVLRAPIASASAGSIGMTADRLARVLRIGKNFAAGANEVFAWRDTEYLSITNQVTAVRSADSAKDAIAAKPQLIVEVDTATFKGTLESILGAAEETASVQLHLTPERITCTVETGSSRGKAAFKPARMRGAATTVNVSVNHLQDCLGTMDGDTTRLSLLSNNILALTGTDATKITTTAAMATRA